MASITGENPQHHEHMGSAKYHKMRDGVMGLASLIGTLFCKSSSNRNPDRGQVAFSQAIARSRLSRILVSASLKAALTQESHGANCVSETMAMR